MSHFSYRSQLVATYASRLLIALLTLAPAVSLSAPGKMPSRSGGEVVGTATPYAIQPDLRAARRSGDNRIWSQTVLLPGASFVKIHLVNVNLQGADRLVVRGPKGRVIETVTGRGPKDLGSFWALSVPGDSAVLELIFRGRYRASPFAVDKVIAGNTLMLAADAGASRSLCGAPDFEDAICYQGDAAKWANVQASVGVMSVGGDVESAIYCSGSNVSPRNYILTNNHCVTGQAQCNSTEFVFRHYRTGCNDGSPVTQDWVSFRCDELLVSQPLVDCDARPGEFDFSLLSVIGEPTAEFGYIQPDAMPLTDGEALYIVQHPAGRPHEITHGSDTDVDGTVLRYWNTLDTETGSSGSPIFRESDDRLVGLHHCGGCDIPEQRNRGMLMTDLRPLIQPYLCSETDSLLPAMPGALTEVGGNDNGVPETGETWSFVPRVLNANCSGTITNARATVALAAGNEAAVTLLDSTVMFGSVPAGETADGAAVAFTIDAAAQCGDLISIEMDPLAADQGKFPGALQVSANVGTENFDTLLFQDFSSGLPADWTVSDLGTGAGPAQTWSADNPGNRSLPFVPPFAIVDSGLHDGFMDEELVTPVIDASAYPRVVLQFSHDFNWDAPGGTESASVDVRSTATQGGWLNVAGFAGADESGTAAIDLSAWAAADLEVRFRYVGEAIDGWWAIDDVYLLGSTGFACPTPGDSDADGALDDVDNCPETPNPSQADTDGDGIGNGCDADIDGSGDCLVNLIDLLTLRRAFLAVPGSPGWNPDADFDSNGTVNLVDLLLLRRQFLGSPGPGGTPNDCQ